MSPDSDKNRELLAEAVAGIPVLGKLLALIVRQQRWRFLTSLALAVLILVIYPIVVPIIAATLINSGILAGLQRPYSESVRKAFGMDQAAIDAERKSNRMLDYFQMIEGRADAGEPRSYTLSVQPYQRIRLRTSDVELQSESKACEVPLEFLKPGAKVFSLELGNMPLGDVSNGRDDEIFQVTRAQWERMMPRLDAGRLQLSLIPVETLRRIGCDGVKTNVRITIEVFKDLLPRENLQTEASIDP